MRLIIRQVNAAAIGQRLVISLEAIRKLKRGLQFEIPYKFKYTF